MALNSKLTIIALNKQWQFDDLIKLIRKIDGN